MKCAIVSLILIGLSAFSADKAAKRPAVEQNSQDSIEITSEKARFDQKASIATFVGLVEADDGESKLKCEHMEVFLSENQEPEKIICQESVVIRREGSVSNSDRAVYFVADQKLVLTGNAKVVSTNSKGEKTITKGRKIVHDLKRNVVEVSGSRIDLTMKGGIKKVK